MERDLFHNSITCLCSCERKTRVDSGVALRWSPLPINVRWPFLEQDQDWLLAGAISSLSAVKPQSCRWTPSYCSPGAVRHSPVRWLLRAWLCGSQLHSCSGEYGLHSPRDTLPPKTPSWTCRHFPINLFWILKPDTSVKDINKLKLIIKNISANSM